MPDHERTRTRMKPYYEDELVTLYHADCREGFADYADEEVDLIVTDPPYTERVHKNSRRGKPDPNTAIGHQFGEITDDDLTDILTQCGRITAGWVIANMDYHHAVAYDLAPPPGLTMKRIGIWLKKSPIPQFTGDRPAQGWEAIAYMHRDDRKSTWNGGGHAGNFHLPAVSGMGHPTSKPPAMIEQFVDWFSNPADPMLDKPADLILDPFAGSGTTLRAAKNLGRRAIGYEVDEKYCELIANRLSQEVLLM